MPLKWNLRNRNARETSIPATTVDRLFELYQHFVFDRLENIRWCVSAILKDRPLRDGQIQWLLDHHRESAHVVNRLLRYPEYHPPVADWARSELKRSELDDRRSELLGRLIIDSIPAEARRMPAATVLWAVYYSSTDLKAKGRMLNETASAGAIDDLIEICMRLRLPDILHRFRDQG